MRLSLLIVLAAGCSTPHYTDGALRCAPSGKACPDNFFCAADQRCWTVGSGPDLGRAEAAPLDLSSPAPPPDLAAVDLSVAAPLVDLMKPDDATPIPLLQLGHVASGTSTLTASLPAPSRVGTLLVYTFVFDGMGPATGPAGWTRWSGNSLYNDAEVWFLANNPGGVTSAAVTLNGTSASVGQLSEWQPVAGNDQGAWCWNSNQSVWLKCVTPATAHDQDLAIACFSELVVPAASVSMTPSMGWVNLGNNDSAIAKLHYRFDFALALPLGVAATETETSGSSGTWAGALVTFH